MRCKSCLVERSAEDFYVSNKTTCMECVRAGVRANRRAKIDYYRQFDKQRASLPHRVAARMEYARTDAGKASHRRATKKWMATNPVRRKAEQTVGNALRRGKINRQPCLICGEKAQAHHTDYSRPLEVVWLCSTHHAQAHDMAKAA